MELQTFLSPLDVHVNVLTFGTLLHCSRNIITTILLDFVEYMFMFVTIYKILYGKYKIKLNH